MFPESVLIQIKWNAWDMIRHFLRQRIPAATEVSWKGLKAPIKSPESPAPLRHPNACLNRREFSQMHQRLGSGNLTLSSPWFPRRLRALAASLSRCSLISSNCNHSPLAKRSKRCANFSLEIKTTSSWTREDHPRKQHEQLPNVLRKAPFKNLGMFFNTHGRRFNVSAKST